MAGKLGVDTGGTFTDCLARSPDGEAEALKDNPALIQLRIAEKWDGRLPQVSGGDVIPLLNLQAIKAD